MVGFEKVGKRRVPFAVESKYTKIYNTTLLKILCAIIMVNYATSNVFDINVKNSNVGLEVYR
jgi:hypothetical protein